MIQKISDYFIRKKRIDQILHFLTDLRFDDPLITSHICDVLIGVDKHKEAILLLAEKVKEFPYLIPLLIKQAQAFIKMEYYEYALKLA